MKRWRWYRSLPLSEQFYVEWVAFGIVCLMWTLFVVILAVML